MPTLAGSEYLRFLRIKHKVVQRLTKELKSYQLEVEQHKATVSRMKVTTAWNLRGGAASRAV